MSLRTRELLNLVLVGLLTAAGFASVYIARQDVVSAGSLTYALFFISLFVVAHILLRVRLPNADPYLLPLGGLLCAIGLTEIYRIDPDLAFRQGLWVVVGVLGVRGRRALPARLPGARQRQVHPRDLGHRPARPSGASGHRPHDQRRDALGRHRADRLPARRARQGPDRHLPGRLPARQPRDALVRRRRRASALAEAPRAAPAHLGRRDARPLPDARPGRRAPLLRHLPRHALHGHRALVIRRRRAWASSWRAPSRSTR